MVIGKALFSLFHYYCLNYSFDKIEKDLKIALFRHFINADFANSSEVSRSLVDQFAVSLDTISRDV